MTTIEINSIIVIKRIIKKYEEQYLSYCGAVTITCLLCVMHGLPIHCVNSSTAISISTHINVCVT